MFIIVKGLRLFQPVNHPIYEADLVMMNYIKNFFTKPKQQAPVKRIPDSPVIYRKTKLAAIELQEESKLWPAKVRKMIDEVNKSKIKSDAQRQSLLKFLFKAQHLMDMQSYVREYGQLSSLVVMSISNVPELLRTQLPKQLLKLVGQMDYIQHLAEFQTQFNKLVKEFIPTEVLRSQWPQERMKAGYISYELFVKLEIDTSWLLKYVQGLQKIQKIEFPEMPQMPAKKESQISFLPQLTVTPTQPPDLSSCPSEPVQARTPEFPGRPSEISRCSLSQGDELLFSELRDIMHKVKNESRGQDEDEQSRRRIKKLIAQDQRKIQVRKCESELQWQQQSLALSGSQMSITKEQQDAPGRAIYCRDQYMQKSSLK